jgi:hypothetical protein
VATGELAAMEASASAAAAAAALSAEVVDGVFEPVAVEEGVCDGVIFHPATGVYADTVAQVQASLRLPLLRAFVGRGLLEGFEAKEMLAYRHSGFSGRTAVARICRLPRSSVLKLRLIQ